MRELETVSDGWGCCWVWGLTLVHKRSHSGDDVAGRGLQIKFKREVFLLFQGLTCRLKSLRLADNIAVGPY